MANSDDGGDSPFPPGSLRHAVWVSLKQASREGHNSLHVEEILRRTKEAKSVEEGYYDWAQCSAPVSNINSAVSAPDEFVKLDNDHIGLHGVSTSETREGVTPTPAVDE
eukprot:CAMPEP_0118951618 /NCGR_PEP_ID=MMETSP1169-20130426/53431_1 /TAXON_ID=36882 /ORGANISM="Pyramimonas obovata, Strain CCMP722" /LENGTH=108 /DNA_ID=CAMNT_0006898703 /DNA_START=101 /DNA_END=424 /DNA_ORIENTATION=+